MLAPLKLFATKLAIFTVVLLYLALDLWLFQGPVWKIIHEKPRIEDQQDKPLARLYGEALRQSDWTRQASIMAFERGLERMPEQAHDSVLMELLRRALLRIRVHYNDNNVPRFEKEARVELARMSSRAASPEAWAQHLADHGETEQSLLQQIEGTLRQQHLLERGIKQVTQVSDEELAQYYDALKQELLIPASRRVRHLFLRHLNRDASELKTQIESLYQRVLTGESLAELARQHSEDRNTAAQGGDLGIIYESNQLPLPELQLFGADALEAGKPTLIKSRWGWHIVLADDITPARIPTLAEVEPSLRSALESARRAWAVDQYFQTSFQSLFNDEHIHIYER